MVSFKKPILHEKLEIDNRLQSEKLSMYRMITNPTGKYSAMVANRGMMIEMLDMKFVKLLKERNFTTRIFWDESSNRYLYHVKVPSETFNKMHYDVVIDVNPSDNGSTIKEPAKFFSNDPHFIYTYANVLYVNDKIPTELYGKLNKKTKENSPKIKNPLSSLGFIKSIYYAIRYLRYMDLLNVKQSVDVKKYRIKYSKSALLSKIATFDEILTSVKKHKSKKTKKSKKKVKRTVKITKIKKRRK